MTIKRLVKSAKFPQVGILRKGAVKVSDKKPGQDLDYFRFVATDQGEIGREVAEVFYSAYGREPRQINVFLPYKTADACFSFWQEHWVAGGLIHRCDGETCVLHRTPTGGYSTEPIPCPGGCKEVGYLNVIVPELGRLALVTVLTSSQHDIMELQENLLAAEAMRGDLRGIPFILRRRPRLISTPEIVSDRKDPNYGKPTGRRLRREKWLLCVETAPQWVALQLTAMQQAALPEVASRDRIIESDYRIVHQIEEMAIPTQSPFDEEDAAPEIEPEPTKDEFDLTKVEFVNKVKNELGIDPIVTGYVLKASGLMNGKGYEKERAREYWEVLKGLGMDCRAFVNRVLENIPFYKNAAHIFETLTAMEATYSAEIEDFLFSELDASARNVADIETTKEEIPF